MTYRQTEKDALSERIRKLAETDAQFKAAQPDPTVIARLNNSGSALGDLIADAMTSYADRPAIGERAVELVKGQDGRNRIELLPRFETSTYGEVWARIRSIARGVVTESARVLAAGDRVCTIGFPSADYLVLDLALTLAGAVTVPLQTNLSIEQYEPILAETESTAICCGIDYLADAVTMTRSAGTVRSIIVFDARDDIDDHLATLQAARQRLSETAGCRLFTLGEITTIGEEAEQSALPIPHDDAALASLIYTSGSTGTPKGAMYSQRVVAGFWRTNSPENATPSIVLGCLPLDHGMGRARMYQTLSAGGTIYFTARSDLSTLSEDLSLVRPTRLDLVPRIWDMLFQGYRSDVERRITQGIDPESAEDLVAAEYRREVLGGRYISASTGAAPLAAEISKWAEEHLGVRLSDAYGSTEAACEVLVDGVVQRPAVIDYRILDVPELGYFRTDHPFPRGELAIKTATMFSGYYRRPDLNATVFDDDGYYRTGDIMAETEPGHFRYVDRRNNVLKLSQGEFVTLSSLESTFSRSSAIEQIFLYGNSSRPYLLAVIVPTAGVRQIGDADAVRQTIAEALSQVAHDKELKSFEAPRDFIIEPVPFTVQNGLLTALGKPARPKLTERYGKALKDLYEELAEQQAGRVAELMAASADAPTFTIVTSAAGALLGGDSEDLMPDTRFTDLGGDSLTAVSYAKAIRDIVDVSVPIGVIISPTATLATIAEYIDNQKLAGSLRPSMDDVHGENPQKAHASDLRLDLFIDPRVLHDAKALALPVNTATTVLLTGATGFLGRYLTLEWLERVTACGGTLICLVRARDDDAAHERLTSVFTNGDAELARRYNQLADKNLRVLAADLDRANLGLDQHVWNDLTQSVDTIVHSAALVNHRLAYRELFSANVVGMAELIGLAVTHKLKPISFVSTVTVGWGVHRDTFTEDADIRQISAERADLDAGYATSKWACEVLLRNIHELCGLPVTVFRCDMIMAEPQFAGQLNLPDRITRLLLSILATGVAPRSFYVTDSKNRPPRAHYDGLPVDFVAQAIAALHPEETGFTTYHVLNPHDDGIGLDQFVEWLIEAGYSITKVDDYDDWFTLLKSSLLALPAELRQASLLPLLEDYRHPEQPSQQALASTAAFEEAVRMVGVGRRHEIPHLTPANIIKYAKDLRLLQLLPEVDAQEID